MNTHLRGDNTEMQEDRPSEQGDSPYYLDEGTRPREVVCMRSFLKVVLLSFYCFILPQSSKIHSLYCLLRQDVN